jgi:ABC-type lipoprotein release transport system permease subunit
VLGYQEIGLIAAVGLLLALLGSMVAAYWAMKMNPASILAARS